MERPIHPPPACQITASRSTSGLRRSRSVDHDVPGPMSPSHQPSRGEPGESPAHGCPSLPLEFPGYELQRQLNVNPLFSSPPALHPSIPPSVPSGAARASADGTLAQMAGGCPTAAKGNRKQMGNLSVTTASEASRLPKRGGEKNKCKAQGGARGGGGGGTAEDEPAERAGTSRPRSAGSALKGRWYQLRCEAR